MHAKITAHRGFLIFDLLATCSIEDEVATSIDRPGNFGQVIMNTAKNVGISPEALELLKKIKPGRDSIGDVDWFSSDDGMDNFAWIGGPKAIKDTRDSDLAGSRDYRIRETFVSIPNESDPGAIAAIEEILKKEEPTIQ